MISVKNVEIMNLEGAIRGMRNPLDSHDIGDSYFDYDLNEFIVEPNDLMLGETLTLAGTDHGKFARQILVSMDITAPRFWWTEMDTYKVGTTANSESTMHNIHKNPFSIDNFSFSQDWIYELKTNELGRMVALLNHLRDSLIKTGDKRYWRMMIEMLPQSYNQTRAWTGNYAVLRNIYFSRKGHKLQEWKDFCQEIENLPYSCNFITIEKEERK